MNEDSQQRFKIINNIRNYRSKERLAFNRTIKEHGVNDKALLQLDNLTHTYQDEHDVRQAKDLRSVRKIINDYNTSKNDID